MESKTGYIVWRSKNLIQNLNMKNEHEKNQSWRGTRPSTTRAVHRLEAGLEAAATFILFLGSMERGVRGGLETARWFRTGNVDKCCICLFMFEFGALFLALALIIRVFILGVLWHGAPRERAKRGDGRRHWCSCARGVRSVPTRAL